MSSPARELSEEVKDGSRGSWRWIVLFVPIARGVCGVQDDSAVMGQGYVLVEVSCRVDRLTS